MNKGYAFGFLVIILVLILGMYVAYTGFMSSRAALRAQPTSTPASGVAEATRPPTEPLPTATPTLITIPTPIPGVTATLTAMMPTVESEQPSPTDPPAPPATESPTEPPPQPPTDMPTLQPPPPTPAPVPAYAFRLAGPPVADPGYPSCCYLYGTVRDAAGAPLEGVQVQALNEWNTLPPAATKGGGEAGQYNIPIGHDAVHWDMVILDAVGNQISPKVQVQFDPGVANAYRIDWQRTY
jgi:hypothetical protein